MKRTIVLPRYLCHRPGTVLEDFEDYTEWTVVAGNTPSSDAVNYKTGSKSLRIDTTGQATNTFYKTVSWDLSSPLDNNLMELWIRWSAATYDSNLITIRLATDSGMTKYFYVDLDLCNTEGAHNAYSNTADPWHILRIGKNDWTAFGGMTWSDVIGHIRIYCPMTSSRNHVYNFDSLKKGCEYIPAFAIRYDDGYASQLTIGAKVHRDRRIRAFTAITSGWLNTSTYLTTGQLRELIHRHGWLCGNHSQTHTAWGTLTQAQIEAELNACVSDLNSLGIQNKANVFGNLTHNNYMVQTYNALLSLGVKAFGGSEQSAKWDMTTSLSSDGYPNMHNLRHYPFEGTSLATAQGYIDVAARRQTIAMFYTHDIGAGNVDGAYGWSENETKGLIDYALQKRLIHLTIEEIYNLTLGPIRVTRPW